MNWTYLSVGTSVHTWLVPFLPQILHFACFLFPIQFFILDLNLHQDSGRKSSRPIGLVLASSFASLSAVLFYWMPQCPGAHIMVTWFSSNSAVSFSIQSATSSDLVLFTGRDATAALLSAQIVIGSVTSLFLGQLVTQSSIAAGSAWTDVAVASCSRGMWKFCFGICRFLPQSLADYRLQTRCALFSAVWASFSSTLSQMVSLFDIY